MNSVSVLQNFAAHVLTKMCLLKVSKNMQEMFYENFGKIL